MYKHFTNLIAFLILFTFTKCGDGPGKEEVQPPLEKARGLLVGRWKVEEVHIQIYNKAGVLTFVRNSTTHEVIEYHFSVQDLRAVFSENSFVSLAYSLVQQGNRLLINTTTYLDSYTYLKQEKEVVTLTQDKLTLRTVQLKMEGKARVEEIFYLTRL